LVIPSINCPDFKTAKQQIEEAEGFSSWIHIDVSDGKFTKTSSWRSSAELKTLSTKLNVEVHLMVLDPEEVAKEWLEAGAKRLIVHVQEMRDPGGLLSLAEKYNADVMLSLDPTQSVEKAIPYTKDFKSLHILTVFPGPSGQSGQPGWAEKIRALREVSPTATIEVDGEMNPENARIAKDAGADVLISGHYIFSSPDPKGAYEKLDSI